MRKVTYQDLVKAYRMIPAAEREAAFKAALTTVVRPPITNADYFGVLFNDAPWEVVAAFIQREAPRQKGDRDLGIPDVQEETVCPHCGETLRMSGRMEVDADYNVGDCEQKWECPHCGATGTALYEPSFWGHSSIKLKEE